MYFPSPFSAAWICLQVLKQDAAFDALQWFGEVQAYLKAAGSVPEASAGSGAALPARLGRWVLSSMGLSNAHPPAASQSMQQDTSRPVSDAYNGLAMPSSVATASNDSLASLGLLSLPAVQQQPAHAHAAQLRVSQAKASAAEASHLANTLQTARTLLSC